MPTAVLGMSIVLTFPRVYTVVEVFEKYHHATVSYSSKGFDVAGFETQPSESRQEVFSLDFPCTSMTSKSRFMCKKNKGRLLVSITNIRLYDWLLTPGKTENILFPEAMFYFDCARFSVFVLKPT